MADQERSAQTHHNFKPRLRLARYGDHEESIVAERHFPFG